MKKIFPLSFLGALLIAGCTPDTSRRPHGALFIGIDVSGSFYKGGPYADAIAFAANYIYGHLKGFGRLQMPKDLFVGSIGGSRLDEPKAFHPINDFQDKSPAQIEVALKSWFPESDRITDFDVFFRQVAEICQKRNLSLAPITVVLLTDGIPAVPGVKGDKPDIGRFGRIDMSPLEYLSHNVTLRLLYVNPTVADKWESGVSHHRVRMWTVDDQVMAGWKNQLKPDLPLEQQENFWKWVSDNVDFRVRMSRFNTKLFKKKS